MKRFSIILPVRNGGAYVKACVESILAQTTADFTLHILDNCSTDGTSEWLQTLTDKRIVFYPAGRSLSIVENWARIKELPRNEFMTMIGHDDIFYPTYLEEMEALIKKHPEASLYQAHYNYIDAQGRFIRPCMPMDEKQYGHEFLACQMARTMESMGTGYMMRSVDFDRLGGMPVNYPNLIFADYQLWVELSLISYKATTQRFCFGYRIHNSVSKLTNGDEYQQAFGIYVSFLRALKEKNKQVQLVVEHYGYDFLMYFCESLSHRLLKTPVKIRTINVTQFIDRCIQFASQLIPGKEFMPLKKGRIRLAKQLDSSYAGRTAFLLAKRIMK